MERRLLAPVALLWLMTLGSCGREPPNPYANGPRVPWSYAAPVVTPQRLTNGVNNLYFEPILTASNAWGPVEVNRSNGERGADDGRPLTLDGKVYGLGYGVHADSELRFSLRGTNAVTCSTFDALVGVDDEVGGRGSVEFHVLLDGVEAYRSGVLTGASAARPVHVELGPAQELRLVVTSAGDGIDFDHADWVQPTLTCSPTPLNLRLNFTSTVDGPPGEYTLLLDLAATVSATGEPYTGPVTFRLRVRNPGPWAEFPDLLSAPSLPTRVPVRVRLLDPTAGGYMPGSTVPMDVALTFEDESFARQPYARLEWTYRP